MRRREARAGLRRILRCRNDTVGSPTRSELPDAVVSEHRGDGTHNSGLCLPPRMTFRRRCSVLAALTRMGEMATNMHFFFMPPGRCPGAKAPGRGRSGRSITWRGGRPMLRGTNPYLSQRTSLIAPRVETRFFTYPCGGSIGCVSISTAYTVLSAGMAPTFSGDSAVRFASASMTW